MAVAASSNGEGESVFPTRSGSGGVRSIVSYSTVGRKGYSRMWEECNGRGGYESPYSPLVIRA